MNSKQISRLIGRSLWRRRAGYALIHLTTLREWYIARAMRRLLAAPAEMSSALDAGCGMGQHTYALARRAPALRIEAVEQDAEQAADLADFFQRLGLERVQVRAGDITRDDLGGAVDLILCCSVLEHIPDDLALLQRFHALLRERGSLLIYVPLSERRVLKSLERRIAAMTRAAGGELPHGHVRYYTPELLASRLGQCGFEVTRRELSYGPCGRLAYDLVTAVQFSSLFLVLFPFYLVLVHPFVLLLMAIDYFSVNRDGNGLLIVAGKSGGITVEETADAANPD
ncbi:MAG TPA: methyltransferase domain-containing protein [bacterium]|nr:methyltransferase domain-containing protein [bacterium]HOC23847.1 methyltransferase domain-containing protein [bacterium]HPG82407.1 methyltransferase domain-containing protein [bacterium]HPM60100.1 methyltransferase domain-containing protein [bacterium]